MAHFIIYKTTIIGDFFWPFEDVQAVAFVPCLHLWKLRFRGGKPFAQEFRKEGGMWGWSQIPESQVRVLCCAPEASLQPPVPLAFG